MLKWSMLFTARFTWKLCAQWHCVKITNTKFHPYQTWYTERTRRRVEIHACPKKSTTVTEPICTKLNAYATTYSKEMLCRISWKSNKRFSRWYKVTNSTDGRWYPHEEFLFSSWERLNVSSRSSLLWCTYGIIQIWNSLVILTRVIIKWINSTS